AKRFMVQATPGAGDLAARLERRGFERRAPWIRLVRDATPPPAVATEFRIAPLGAADDATFGAITGEAFGYPPAMAAWAAALVGRSDWTVFGAWDGDRLVAAGGVHGHG